MKKENWKKIKTKELNNFTFHKWWEEGEKEVRKFTERIIGQARQEIIKEILSKMEIEINGRDITIYELGDWLVKLKSQLNDEK